MELYELRKRALEVRKLYESYEVSKTGRTWTREELLLGMLVDFGDFTRLAMAKEGIRTGKNIDERLSHEFGDLLWSLFVLSESYGIDLEKAYLSTVSELKLSLQNKNMAQPVAGGDATR